MGDNAIRAILKSFSKKKKETPPTFKTVRKPDSKELDLSIIKEFEGLRLTAYMPTPNDVPTIGYGHTKNVRMGTRISKEKAEIFLEQDVAWAVEAVENKVKVPLNMDQKAALVSFTFNVGASAFSNSTLVRVLNSGDYLGAANQLLRWNKQGKKVLRGLTRRRKAERSLFLGD